MQEKKEFTRPEAIIGTTFATVLYGGPMITWCLGNAFKNHSVAEAGFYALLVEISLITVGLGAHSMIKKIRKLD